MRKLRHPAPQRSGIVRGIVISTAVVAAIFAVLAQFEIQQYVLRLFEWLDGLGAWGPVLFIIIYALIVIFVLPGILFTLGAGFLFGVIEGSLYVVIANTLGATFAFMIARYALSKRAAKYLLTHPELKTLDDEFMPKGWKIVLVTRMVPFFPFKLSNYFFGLTRITLRGFVVGHFIGNWPLTINIAYIGSMAADLAMLGAPGGPRSPFEWIINGGGFILAAVTGLYFAGRAQKVLDSVPPSPDQIITRQKK